MLQRAAALDQDQISSSHYLILQESRLSAGSQDCLKTKPQRSMAPTLLVDEMLGMLSVTMPKSLFLGSTSSLSLFPVDRESKDLQVLWNSPFDQRIVMPGPSCRGALSGSL